MVSLVFTFLCFSSSRRLLQLSQGSIFKLSWLLVKGKSWSNKESSSAWRAGCAPFTGLSWASESSSATTTRSLLKRESPSSLTSSEKSKALVSFKKSGASSFLSRDLRRFHAPGPAMAAEGRRLRLHRRSGSSGQRRASLPIVRRTRPAPPAAPRSRASSGVARDPTALSYPGPPPPPPPRIPFPEARAAESRTGIEAELQPLHSPAREARGRGPRGHAGRPRLGGARRGRGHASPPAPAPPSPAPSPPRSGALRALGCVAERSLPGWVSLLAISLHWRWVWGISGPILVMDDRWKTSFRASLLSGNLDSFSFAKLIKFAA